MKWSPNRLLLISIAAFFAASAVSFAQSSSENANNDGSIADAGKQKVSINKSGGSKKTTVNFEDQLIEGQTQKPELFYLLQQRNNNFKRLIKLRENFLPEMRKTSDDFNRKGSGN
jgi:thioredoxin-like negative regulator of GroEL